MRLKQYARYQMRFYGKWVTASGAFMGMSVFLRMLHFFAFDLFTGYDGGTVFFHLILPVALAAVYIVLLNCIHWNAPGIYGILGFVFCLILLGRNLSCGDPTRILLSMIWYLIAGLILLATVGGYVPGRFLAFLCFLIPLGVRIFLYDLGNLSWREWIPEGADLCIIGALMCLPFSLMPGKHKQTEEK